MSNYIHQVQTADGTVFDLEAGKVLTTVNIKTINNTTVVGSGNITLPTFGAIASATAGLASNAAVVNATAAMATTGYVDEKIAEATASAAISPFRKLPSGLVERIDMSNTVTITSSSKGPTSLGDNNTIGPNAADRMIIGGNLNSVGVSASANDGIVTGLQNIVSGTGNITIGQTNTNTYNNTAILGQSNIATQSNQTIVGQYNAPDNGQFLVGVGTNGANRENALTASPSGVYLSKLLAADPTSGNLSAGATNQILTSTGDGLEWIDNRVQIGYSEDAIIIGKNYVDSGMVYPETAGMKAFCWSAVSNSGLRYTFTLSDGSQAARPITSVPAGALVSVKADYSWSFAGTLVYAISTSSIQVVVDIVKTPPSNWIPSSYIDDPQYGYLWFPDVPEAGVIPKGNGATSLGEGNRANEEGATATGRQNIADGRYSFAVGRSNKAGYSGFAEGQNTSATGLQSHSEGYNTTASGNRSHAEGSDSKAIGDKAHAEGQSTEATGINSHAEGWSSKASGRSSHAEGLWTLATQENQHTQGKYNVALGSNYVDIVGWGVDNTHRSNISVLDSSGNLHIAGSIYVGATGDCTNGTELVNPDLSSYVPKTYLNGTDMVQLDIQGYSGQHLTNDSYSGNRSLDLTIANPSYGTTSPKISLKSTTSENIQNAVEVEGNKFTYNGADVATQTWVGQQGYINSSIASNTYMAKSNPTGTGSLSLNRRSGTTVGINSVAEGGETTASGQNSHAEGNMTQATATNAHAEGWSSRAFYNQSHAEGLWTITGKECQHTQGQYNVQLTGNYADIVGWGTGDSARKNISVLDTSGNLYIAGKVYVQAPNNNCTSGTELAGIPTGGTTGQVLTKTSGSDYAVAWANAPSGSNEFVIEGQDIDSQDPLEHTFKHEAYGITTSTTDAIQAIQQGKKLYLHYVVTTSDTTHFEYMIPLTCTYDAYDSTYPYKLLGRFTSDQYSGYAYDAEIKLLLSSSGWGSGAYDKKLLIPDSANSLPIYVDTSSDPIKYSVNDDTLGYWFSLFFPAEIVPQLFTYFYDIITIDQVSYLSTISYIQKYAMLGTNLVIEVEIPLVNATNPQATRKIANVQIIFDTTGQAATAVTVTFTDDTDSATSIDNMIWYGTCSTAAATAAKVATVDDGFTLIKGAVAFINFTYTNSASTPTLNINNTGAKQIRYYENADTPATVLSPVGLLRDGTNRLVYDGTYWVLDANTNNKVTQSDSTENEAKQILLSPIGGSSTAGTTSAVRKSSNLTFNPSTKELAIASGGHIKTDGFYAPTTSGGSTYGVGTSGQVLTSNGSSVYWADASGGSTLITGTTNPTTSTQGDVGQKYLNTTTEIMYVCTYATSGTYHWKPITFESAENQVG